MDKFGIFNLLNSFFPLSSQKNENSPVNSSGSGFANNLISALGKSLLGPTTSQPNVDKNSSEPPKQPVPLPLQKSMLLTINSHDEIVKRVKEKNKHFTP